MDRGFPEDELATLLTCWDYPEGRVHLAYDHPDKELSVFITLASYPLPGGASVSQTSVTSV